MTRRLVANRAFMLALVREWNAITPDELAAKLRDVPTRNLVVAREAAREFDAMGVILPADVRMVEVAVTTEIDRRWL